jgi:hypothetical protein
MLVRGRVVLAHELLEVGGGGGGGWRCWVEGDNEVARESKPPG